MQRHFHEELKGLNKDLIRMTGLVEAAIRKSIQALEEKKPELAREVIDGDGVVDGLENEIDEKCIHLIAQHQPMAGDLRFIATAMRINSDLERIADLAVNISWKVIESVENPILEKFLYIPQLSSIAEKMLQESIYAFIEKDVERAKQVILSDSEADRLRNSVQEMLIRDYIEKDLSSAKTAVYLIVIARSLERICDHTTNIAEEVIYMVEGKVVKHHPSTEISGS